MLKKKICLIAQFAPPIHGLSKAVETLYNSKLNQEFEFEKINITKNKKIIKNFFRIWKSNADLFYFTISQTKGGNIRDLIILNLLSLQKKKCLVHLHGGYYRKLVENDLSGWQKKLNFKAINRLNGAIVLSDSLKSIFKGMITDEKIFVVPNCVDDQFLMSDLEFDDKISKLKNKEVFHVLYLSNFIQTKGYREVLELAKLEKKRVSSGEKKHLHFDFAGKFFEDTEKEYFDTFIKNYDLNNYITYHGIVGGEQKKKLLKDSNIFILLTRYPNEGQPISILEAMGNGMIIVTTNHAGIPDVVTNNVNGIVFDVKDIDADTIYQKIISIPMKQEGWFNESAKRNRFDCLGLYDEYSYLSNLRIIINHICSNGKSL